MGGNKVAPPKKNNTREQPYPFIQKELVSNNPTSSGRIGGSKNEQYEKKIEELQLNVETLN